MALTRSSLVLSLLAHGAALGTVCWIGVETPVPASAPVRCEVQLSAAAAFVESPPPAEWVRVENVEAQPPLAAPTEPDPPSERDAFEPEPEMWFVPSKDTVLSADWLVVVKPRIDVVEPLQPSPPRPAPAALVLEVVPGENPPPDYPWLARRRGWQGVVAIFVHVDSGGGVTAAAVARSSGHDVLDQAALEAVRGWRFRGGVGETTVEVEFRLRG